MHPFSCSVADLPRAWARRMVMAPQGQRSCFRGRPPARVFRAAAIARAFRLLNFRMGLG